MENTYKPLLVLYTTSNTHNCKDFVSKLNYEYARELKSPEDFPEVPYILVTGTYADAAARGSLHEKVYDLLQNVDTAKLLRGVCASGNRNFGALFCVTSKIISEALNVPRICDFELKGFPSDVKKVREWIDNYNKEAANGNS